MSEADTGDVAGPGWLHRLKKGLSRSSSNLVSGISDLFTKRKLDAAAIEDLEDFLITADLGVATAARITEDLARTRFGREISPDEVRDALAASIATILEPVARPLNIDRDRKPHVILFCGVNGSGKTTTIGKLTAQLRAEGRTVMLAAADTFRAAAIEQLQVWGQRTDTPVITARQGADAAGLAFDALEKARAENIDVLMIDTAGRLQNKSALMDELKKIIRVIRKLDDTAPHDCILVMDATIGQNAISQVAAFRDIVEISGLVVTKLDGTAKGGVLVSLADQFALPVHAVGVGEGIDDLRPFDARAFSRSLLGFAD